VTAGEKRIVDIQRSVECSAIFVRNGEAAPPGAHDELVA